MRLFTNPVSPFCRTAAICLDEKSLAFETVEITTGAERAQLVAASPRGELPVLETDIGVLEGSTAICDFAERARPEPALVPVDPAERVRFHRLEEAAHATTDALQFLVHLVSFRRPELQERFPALRADLEGAVRDHYAFLGAALGGDPSLAGRYSRADVLVFAMVSSLVSMRCAIPVELPALAGWFGRVASRPAVARDLARANASEAAQRASADPFFRADRIHWRGPRVEWACRVGLAHWLADEIDEGRAFFSALPGGNGEGPGA